MPECPNVGIVKFWCYSNDRNNNLETSSVSYRFLKDAVVNAVAVYLRDTKEHSLNVRFAIGCPLDPNAQSDSPQCNGNGAEHEKREEQYVAQEPDYSFDRLIVNNDTRASLIRSAKLFDCYDLIFNTWGLRANSPHPVVALNFFGPPGTGKTLAAHAIASYLKKKIILASYAQIESMYHGEGPKNVEAIFRAAEKQNAILFIDEADSLLSKRLTDVRNGSDNAVNSMRSQILICLEKFSGIVIFATNLVTNYDRAFESRVRSINFPLPDEECRYQIWAKHLPEGFPAAKDLDIRSLAKLEDISGREIRNAIQDVAEQMAIEHLPEATLAMLEAAVNRIKQSRFTNGSKIGNKAIQMTEEEKRLIADTCVGVLNKDDRIDESTDESGTASAKE